MQVTRDSAVNLTLQQQTGLFLRQHWHKGLALLLWGLFIGAYFYTYRQSGLNLNRGVTELVYLLQRPYGPLLYLLLFLLRPLLFFSAGILAMIGGLIFGTGTALNLALATSYALVGTLLSAVVTYLIGRFLGHGLLPETVAQQESFVQRYRARLQRSGFWTVLLMRLFLVPFDVVNYLAAFVLVDWKAYTLASAIGLLPSTLAFVTFGAAIDIQQLAAGQRPTIDLRMVWFAVALISVSLLISRVYSRIGKSVNR
ncbi:MAG: VTT domain-containing protein [Caldilineaceae bacterium]